MLQYRASFVLALLPLLACSDDASSSGAGGGATSSTGTTSSTTSTTGSTTTTTGATTGSGGSGGAGGGSATGGAGGSSSSAGGSGGSGGGSAAALPSLWNDVAVGTTATCAVASDQTLWCWGANNYGQVGIGSAAANVPTPTQVGSDSDWEGVEGVADSYCARKTDNTLWCWGYHALDATTNPNAPVQVTGAPTFANWTEGLSGGCGVTANGTMFCWGSPFSANGMWPNGDTGPKATAAQWGTATDWSAVGAGRSFACALKTNQTLHCVGGDNAQQQGNGPTMTNANDFVQVGNLTNWTGLYVGYLYAVATRNGGGELVAWGDSFYGQTGTGGTADVNVPTVVASSVPSTVGTGQNHTCSITAGALSCWGRQQYGALGDGVATDTKITSPIAIGTDTDWLRVDTGTQHTCALKTGATLWCWGGNGSGQVGMGATSTEQLAKFQVGGP